MDVRKELTITQTLNYSSGVIHVINKVLTVPVSASQTFLDAGLSSLYGALNATSLLSTVDGLENVTIFAPSNTAFESIGSLLSNASTSTLTSILEYHVVEGSGLKPFYSTSLMNGSTITTLGGGSLTVYLVNGSVFVNNARVTNPDLLIAYDSTPQQYFSRG
jgi:uncharacterized surface protein with fasciclin (FAS1) repeats